MRKLFTFKTTLTLLALISAFLANYMVNDVLARCLGAAHYGDFSVATTVIMITATAILLGKDQSIFRFLPLYIRDKDWSSAHGYLQKDFQYLYNYGALLLIIGAIIAIASLSFIHANLDQLEFLHPLFYVIWIIPLFMISVYLSKLINSVNHAFLSVLTSRLFSPVFLGIFIGLIFFIFNNISVYQALFVYGATIFINILIQISVCLHILPKHVFQAAPKYQTALWQKTSFRLFISQLVMQLLFSSQLFLLEAFGKNEASVGIFSAIIVISTFYWLAYNAINLVMKPLVSPAIQNKNHEHLQAIVNFSLCLLFFLITILTYLLFQFRHELLFLFGETFTRGTKALTIVIFGFSIAAFFAPAQNLLFYSGHEDKTVHPLVITFVLNVIIASLLIHLYDLVGAAIALAGSRILTFAWFSRLAKKHLKIKPLVVI